MSSAVSLRSTELLDPPAASVSGPAPLTRPAPQPQAAEPWFRSLAARRARRVGVPLLGVAIVAAAIFSLRDQLPSLSELSDLVLSADPTWLAVALAAEIVALQAMSTIQRNLVHGLGGRLSRRGSMALTLSSGAISFAVPGGSVIAAGYTFKHLRAAGLRAADVAAAMAAGAIALSTTLGVGYLVVASPSIVDGLAGLIADPPAVLVIGLAVLAGLVLLARRLSRSSGSSLAGLHRSWAHAAPGTRARAARGLTLLADFVRDGLHATRSVAPGVWWRSAAWSLLRWSADLGVLIAVALAVGAEFDLVAIATVYVGVQIIRQIPLTPGGVGVVEAALLAGLIAAGSAAGPAAAAVLLYRALTFWMVIPAGAIAALSLRPQPGRSNVAGVAA